MHAADDRSGNHVDRHLERHRLEPLELDPSCDVTPDDVEEQMRLIDIGPPDLDDQPAYDRMLPGKVKRHPGTDRYTLSRIGQFNHKRIDQVAEFVGKFLRQVAGQIGD